MIRRHLTTLLLFVASAIPLPSGAQPFCPGVAPWVFADVQASDSFCTYVTWMAQSGVTLGCQVIDASNRLYCPDDSVTRKQMAAFMKRQADAVMPLTCAAGQVMKWNGAAWTCSDDNIGGSGGGGTVTSVLAGTGLQASPNPITGAGVVNLATSYQLPQSCANGQVPKSNGTGGWTCGADNAGMGTVTSVAAGAGLTGGTITGTGTIAVANAGITAAMLAQNGCSNGQVMKWNGSAWACAADAAGPANAFVQGGNAFGAEAVLGTTSNHALDIRVNGARVMRFAPNALGPNVIGGDASNSAGSYSGQTVAGGGGPDSGCWEPSAGNYSRLCANRANGDYATVGGGSANQALAGSSVVSGGGSNTASGFSSTVGGGQGNTVSGSSSTVGGGQSNTASGYIGTVGGGLFNIASGTSSTVGGGADNAASGAGATVGGGGSDGSSSFFGNAAAAQASTIAGGYGNAIAAGASYGAIGGGYRNYANAGSSTVAGGASNSANGLASTVPGGHLNEANGAYSFAAGRRAKANAVGVFALADSTDADWIAVTPNSFVGRFHGGYGLWTNAANTVGCSLAPGGGTWSCTSSRDQKQDFVPVDGRDVLERVASLPISEWRYRTEVSGARHMGPNAQDFHAAFGLGDSDKAITAVDADGVALAAIQGLNAKLEAKVAAKDAELAALKREMADLRLAVEVLMARTSTDGRVAQTR